MLILVWVCRTYYVYRRSWSAPAGSFTRLHTIFKNALDHLKASVKEKATNNKRKRSDVLRDTIVVKLRGVSSEKALGSVPFRLGTDEADNAAEEDEDETCVEGVVDNQLVISVTGQDGGVVRRAEVSVPLVKFEMDSSGLLSVFLRDPFASEGKGIVSKRTSMEIRPDGSCTGTERAKSLIPLLSAWDREPSHVSKTLGSLLCYCIFCGQQMKKDTRWVCFVCVF